MKYQDAKKLLPLYLEGDLEEKEAEAVREFLARDPRLQQEAHALQRAWNLLGQVDEIEPPLNYVSQFWTELSVRDSWKYRAVSFLKSKFFVKRLVPALTAFSLIVLVGIFSFKEYNLINNQQEEEIAYLSDRDYEMVENMDLAENLDIIEDIDFFDNFDVIEGLEV